MTTTTITMGTGWAGFYNSNPQSPGNYAPRFARSSHEYRAALALSRHGYRKYRAQMKALSGAAAGGSATDTNPRVQQTLPAYQMGGSGLGGTRTVETVTNSTTTTSAMETFLEAKLIDRLFIEEPTISSVGYPTDSSGNGGGGKLGR